MSQFTEYKKINDFSQWKSYITYQTKLKPKSQLFSFSFSKISHFLLISFQKSIKKGLIHVLDWCYSYIMLREYLIYCLISRYFTKTSVLCIFFYDLYKSVFLQVPPKNHPKTASRLNFEKNDICYRNLR